jgi:hypothetical protein
MNPLYAEAWSDPSLRASGPVGDFIAACAGAGAAGTGIWRR